MRENSIQTAIVNEHFQFEWQTHVVVVGQTTSYGRPSHAHQWIIYIVNLSGTGVRQEKPNKCAHKQRNRLIYVYGGSNKIGSGRTMVKLHKSKLFAFGSFCIIKQLETLTKKHAHTLVQKIPIHLISVCFWFCHRREKEAKLNGFW